MIHRRYPVPGAPPDTAVSGGRNLAGHTNRIIQITGLDQVKAGQLFLGFCKRTIRHTGADLTVTHAQPG